MIGLQADGSAMYTLQGLWTQARERLPVTTLLLSNRKYQILLGEYANVGANPGRTALDMMDLGNPDIDWVRIANGMGVEVNKHAFDLAQPIRVSLATSSNFLPPFEAQARIVRVLEEEDGLLLALEFLSLT